MVVGELMVSTTSTNILLATLTCKINTLTKIIIRFMFEEPVAETTFHSQPLFRAVIAIGVVRIEVAAIETHPFGTVVAFLVASALEAFRRIRLLEDDSAGAFFAGMLHVAMIFGRLAMRILACGSEFAVTLHVIFARPNNPHTASQLIFPIIN